MTTTQETPALTRAGLPGTLPAAAVDAVLRAALAEDAPYGDITSQTLIPADARATAVLAARVPGVFSGGEVFAAAMKLADPGAAVDLLVADGEAFEAGTALARVTGNARGVLLAERVALNLVQRMSAIATRTAEFVALVAGTRARITDTRKTTPGLRVLERYAVRCGGGANHRFSLSDAVLAKDNHLAVLTGGDPAKLTGGAAGRQGAAGAHHALRGGGGQDGPDRARAGRRRGHHHAGQLLAGRTRRRRRAGRRAGPRRGQRQRQPRDRGRHRRHRGGRHLDRRAHPQRHRPGPGPGCRARRPSWNRPAEACRDLPGRRRHHPGPPRGAGGHVAVPQRGLRQPVKPPLARRCRRRGARGGPGSDRQGAGLPAGRGRLHLRRHGGGQPRRQGHRPGPARRGPAPGPGGDQRRRTSRGGGIRPVPRTRPWLRRRRGPRGPVRAGDRGGARGRARAGDGPGQRHVRQQRGRHRPAGGPARGAGARPRASRCTPTPCRPRAGCPSTCGSWAWTR